MIELSSVSPPRARAQVELGGLAIRSRAAAIGVAVLAVLVAFAISYVVYRHFGAPRNEYDLRIYYAALTNWHSGNGLYTYQLLDPVNGYLGFTYPPAAGLAMAPMALVSITTVVVVSTVCIMAATVVLVLLALRERVTLRRPQLAVLTGVATAAACCLQPISQNLAYGQVNVFLAVLVMVDVFVLRRRRSRWAGIGIGLATAIKLTPAIFLIYLLVSGQWRMLRVAVLSAAGVTVLAALCAPAATWQYFTSALWDSSRVGVLDNTANQSINGLLARMSSPAAPDKWLWLLCSLAVVAVGFRRVRRAVLAGDTLLAVGITGLLGVLVSPVSWIHHAVWLVPAMVVLIARLAALPAEALLMVKVDHSLRRLTAGQRREALRWAGCLGMTISGIVIFVLNTRNTFGLPDTHYAGLGVMSVIEGSVQTIWMLLAIAFLPLRRVLAPAPTAVPLVEAARAQP